jgi:flagellar motor switch protein FliM
MAKNKTQKNGPEKSIEPVVAGLGKKSVDPNNDIRSYDFKHPKLVSKEIMRILHNIHEQFTRNLTRIFANTLALRVEVDVLDIDQVVISEYLNTIDVPSTLYLFKITELDDWALMEIDPGFCMFTIERQSGSDDETIGPRRVMTRIEEKILARIINKIFIELSQAWKPHIGFNVDRFIYESKPENIHTLSLLDPALVVKMQISINDQKVPLNICYPYELLKDPLNHSFYQVVRKSEKKSLTPEQKKSYTDYMRKVAAPLQVLLGETTITVSELVELKDGDAIKLDQTIDAPLPIRVNGRDVMNGYPGILKGKKAVKIFSIVETDLEEKVKIDE